MALSKNLNHILSQQIDIANSAAKKFNGWLEQYERMPELIFANNVKIFEVGLETKEEALKDYNRDMGLFADVINKCLKELKNNETAAATTRYVYTSRRAKLRTIIHCWGT